MMDYCLNSRGDLGMKGFLYGEKWCVLCMGWMGRDFYGIGNACQVAIGNGSNIMLWRDVLVESHQLKEAFPRIQALAVYKTCFVLDFYQWQDKKWVWKVELRRPPFDWEKGQWKCFMKCLECVTIQNSVKDTIAWGYSSSGSFSIMSFRKVLEDIEVWEIRNQAVFNAKEANVLQAIDMVKLQVAWWFKHYSKGSNETMTTMLLNIKEICMDSKPNKKHRRAD
ncbi:hypothetical protein Dsin_022420 [Dipteronia sinensis]|uniref:Uncharacterized protein n=1 Tax=Dipteronia sinensis TaxID=43782 RepID=A0AAE0A1H2_9ROSI|nr:hypothetical protein Dsin_022420 [Dipteronia sinensis]